MARMIHSANNLISIFMINVSFFFFLIKVGQFLGKHFNFYLMYDRFGEISLSISMAYPYWKYG